MQRTAGRCLCVARAALDLGVGLGQGVFVDESRVTSQMDGDEQRFAELFHDAVSIRARVEFDAQRTNDMLAVASELGILQQNTGLELQRNTAAIDYLFTRVSTGREQDDD